MIIIPGLLCDLQILNEVGMEDNRSINESDFQQIVKKLPDFSHSFKLVM